MSDQHDEDLEDLDDFFPDETDEERPRDTKIDEAKDDLRNFFAKNSLEVYYIKQVEVFFEKQYFHWITDTAIHELIDEDYLQTELAPLLGKTRVRFITSRSNRYFRRALNRKLEVVRAFSRPAIARACGLQAETLFINAFAERGFVVPGSRDTNSYRGNVWRETGHKIDFIMTRDSVEYGCEVKNTWDYIDREELLAKLGLCRHLQIHPLFIMRYAPKTYLWEYIHRRFAGFWIIFETQIYPFGHETLVERIRDELNLNVDAPRRIPDGIIDRFMRHVHARLVPARGQ